MSQIVLLPCPFCGGEAVMEEIEEKIFGTVRFSVGCATEDEATCMGYQSLTSFSRRCDAASAWNTRALPAQGEPVASLQRRAVYEIVLRELETKHSIPTTVLLATRIMNALAALPSSPAPAPQSGPGWVERTDQEQIDALGAKVIELQREKAEMVKALEKIEKSDRRWEAPYAQDEADIIERSLISGSVLVHGPDGRIARAALALVKP